MNPADQQAVAEREQIEARRVETEKEIFETLNVILRKPKTRLLDEDISFLQARQSYLTDGQREEYKEVLAIVTEARKKAEKQAAEEAKAMPNIKE